MSGVEARFEGDPERVLKEFERRMEAAKEEIAQLQNPHARIATFLDQWVQYNFKSEGGNIPAGWEPFAYGGRLDEDGIPDESAKLLQDTGKLRASFIPFATEKDAGIGSEIPYAKQHQEGNIWENLPEREMLPEVDYPAGKRQPGKSVGERIKEIYKDHVVEIIEAKDWEVDGD